MGWMGWMWGHAQVVFGTIERSRQEMLLIHGDAGGFCVFDCTVIIQ